MIFCAGLGTRLYPLTKDKPKALVCVNGITLLELVINKFIKYNISPIIINVHHFSKQIIDFIDNKKFDTQIIISDESQELLDTGGGLLKAYNDKLFNNKEDILLYNVDILSDLDLNKVTDYHKRNKNLATLCVKNRETKRYLLFDNDNNLCGRTNLNTSQTTITRNCNPLISLAFSGIHIITPQLIEKFEQKGKFSIIEAYLSLSKSYNIKAFKEENTQWFDVGKLETLNSIQKKSNLFSIKI